MSARYPGDADDALSMVDGTPWYVSPDIWLDTAVADVGTNVVNLRAHLLPMKSFPVSQAEIEVFVGNPSLVMSPTAGTVLIGTTLVAQSDLVASPTRSVETTLNWTVPPADPTQPDRPDQPGHRCLVARIYPFGSSKPPDFQVIADQHEAQRNICVVDCIDKFGGTGGAGGGMIGAGETPMGRGEDGLWGFAVDTITLDPDNPEVVAIHATVVDEFAPAELEQLRPLLPEGFRGLAAEPPPTTKLELVTPEKVVDKGGPRTSPIGDFLRKILPIPPLWRFIDKIRRPRRPPGAQVEVELQPGRIARIAVRTDLAATPVHEGQAVRLEQVGAAGDVQGGLLLVLHRVS